MRIQFQYVQLLSDNEREIFIACSVHITQLPSDMYNQWKMCHEGEERITKVCPSCETILEQFSEGVLYVKAVIES